jgi:hypothetical protein
VSNGAAAGAGKGNRTLTASLGSIGGRPGVLD